MNKHQWIFLIGLLYGSQVLANFDNQFKNLLQQTLPNVAVGCLLQDAKTGRVLYSNRASEGFVPASTTKLFTAAAALEYLKPNYCFETRFDFNANHVNNGHLKDNLYLTFTGDPSLTSHDLRELFKRLKRSGVNKITGNLIIDHSRFKLPVHGPGWSIDDVKRPYGAPISAIIIDRNKHNQLAVESPKELAMQHTQAALRATQLAHHGQIQFSTDSNAPRHTNYSIIHYSDSLDKIVKHTLVHSNNIAAESLLKTLGYYYHNQGNFQQGVSASQAILSPITGIDFREMKIYDGSGLSHYNFVTPKHLGQLLYGMYHHELKHVFMGALPISGQTGTLKKRLHTGHVFAKTGTLHGKSALAGYLKHKHHHTLILVIMINQSIAPQATMKKLEDSIVHLVLNSNFS